MYDANVLDILPIEAGSYYVMDRGYLDAKRLYTMNLAKAFFVSRAKSNTQFKRIYSNKRDLENNIICDQIVVLTGVTTSKAYPEFMRRIRLKDAISGKTLIFLTNDLHSPATTIAALYKHRWQVELFFKWIKQHLRIKKFYGTSENAVKTQIWTAVSVYVLVAIVKKQLNLSHSLYTLLQILSVSIFEKIQLQCAFAKSENLISEYTKCNQLNFLTNLTGH